MRWRVNWWSVDTESLLRSFNDHSVEYIVIGATAFPVHGYARATLDIDIFIRPEADNAARTLAALRDFGYDVEDLTVDILLNKKVLIRQYLVETDVHPFVAGVAFERVWRNRIRSHYGKTEVAYASLDDLIAMKEAAGRAKDIEDLKFLRELKKSPPETAR